MKKMMKTVVILTLALALASFTTGCAGCGTSTEPNANDMVESTPVQTEEMSETEAITTTEEPVSDNAIMENGGNATANDITGTGNYTVDENGNYINENGHRVDESGNLLDDAGNIISDAGNAVGDVVEGVGDAAKDVTDGIGEGVKSMTR